MKYLLGALFGAVIAFGALMLTGAIWGGVNMVAPCYGGAASRPVDDRITFGAIFGTLYFVITFGVHAVLIGGISGVSVAAFLTWKRKNAQTLA